MSLDTTLRSSWDSYAEKMLKGIPKESVQYIETEQAFYSGCFCLISRFDIVAELPEDVGVHLYEMMRQEVFKFMRDRVNTLRKETNPLPSTENEPSPKTEPNQS